MKSIVGTILLCSPLLINAQQLTLQADQCVDSSGFSTCMDKANTQTQQCYQQFCNQDNGSCENSETCTTTDPNCATNCLVYAYQSWINCAVQSCWNKAYSCEYQELVIQAVRSLGFALTIKYPPYFPPFNHDPGSCSCSLATVYTALHQALPLANRCQNNGGNGADCDCCAASFAYSILAAECPDTASSSIPWFNSVLSGWKSDFEATQCANLYSQNLDCTALPMNFSLPNNGQFYTPNNLPADGTQSVSDAAGGLSAPAEATFVWSLANGLPPATAIAAGSAAPSGSTSPSSSGSSGSSGGGTGSASASGAKATSKSSDAPGSLSIVKHGLWSMVGLTLLHGHLNGIF